MKLRTNQSRRSRGLTIIELMVSVTILIVMILMTNQLLSASRKTIRIAEDAIKANGDARAVADALRNDLAQLSKQGFLAITYELDEQAYNANPRVVRYLPHLVFTTVGDYTSRIPGYSSVTAKAALIDYGLGAKWYNGTNNPSLVDTPLSPVVMWRRARLLNGMYKEWDATKNKWAWTYNYTNNFPPADLCGDRDQLVDPTQFMPTSLTDMCNLEHDDTTAPTQAYMLNFIVSLTGAETDTNAFAAAFGPGYANGKKDAPRMRLPPANVGEVGLTWPYLVSDVRNLAASWQVDPKSFCPKVNGAVLTPLIQWTDGSRDPATNSIRWFDGNSPHSGRDTTTGDLFWPNRDVSTQWSNPAYNVPEYNITQCNPGKYPPDNLPQYAALWTFRKTDNWPKAIRMEMTVGMGVDSPPRTYEIVIELPN